MKKKVKAVLVMVLSLTAAFWLIGCGSKVQDDTNDAQVKSEVITETDTTAEQEPEAANDGYLFDVNGVAVGADMDMDALAPSLGEAKSVFEAPSCAGQGVAYVYDFGAFEIETYPAEGGKNLIAYITLKDDTVATPEGIDLSMTKADIISAYGEAYTEYDNGLTYKKGNMKLNFILDGDSIVSVEYVSAVIG